MQISQVVQSNAASAEESAAASEELSAQADSLKGIMSVYLSWIKMLPFGKIIHPGWRYIRNVPIQTASFKAAMPLAGNEIKTLTANPDISTYAVVGC